MPTIPRYDDNWGSPCPRYARQSFGARHAEPGFGMHTHAYAEAFWVESGRIRHRANGQERLLVPGDLTFIRPDDQHDGVAVDADGFTVVNVMFHAAALADLRRRYQGDMRPANAWPWHDGPEPRTVHLDPVRLETLQTLIESMPLHGTGSLDRDLLALALVQAARQGDHDLGDEAPHWLRLALRDDAWIEGGVAGLARSAKVSLAHLNRTVRRHCGCTATELLGRRRLEIAARALRLGQERVIDVAQRTGFNNLAYFHRCFRARFGCTPRGYRNQERASFDPPAAAGRP